MKTLVVPDAPKHKTPEYKPWESMRARCNNPNRPCYDRYGGRGIKVCERWNDFSNFLEDVGPRPSPQHSLDRYPNVNGNYEPGNVRWATPKEQARNRRNNHFLTFNEETHTIAEWEEIKGWKTGVIKIRLRYGWPLEKIFTEPVRNHAQNLSHP
jgi:hypothetical protein